MNRDNNQTINGNDVLSAFHRQQQQLPPNYGMIRDLNGGSVLQKIGSSPIKESRVEPPGRVAVDPMDGLSAMVKQYNDYISANDLNDQRIEYADYFNRDSPSYIDQTDPQGIDSEGQYLQNQLYRLQKDKRYIPDYEDVMEMSDEEFNRYDKEVLGQ